jgi:hypothetical protein
MARGVESDPDFVAASAESGLAALDMLQRDVLRCQSLLQLSRSFDVRLRKTTQAFDLAWIFPLL